MKELVSLGSSSRPWTGWPRRWASTTATTTPPSPSTADRVLRLADAMRRELGLEPGDRFAVMACNSHQYLELYHAAFLGAGVVNPLNLRLAGKELQFILADSGTEVVFVDSLFADHFARNIAEVRAELPLRHVVLIGDGDGPHDIRYEDLLAGRPILARRAGRGRPGRAHVHGRYDRPGQGRAARPARRDAEPVPHRHDGRVPRRPRLPAPDPDVPRRLDGRRPRHPSTGGVRCSFRCSSRAR